MVVFLALVCATVPILQMVGFTTTGIVGGSLAAGVMSTAAIINGGGVASMAAGGLVAVAQSIGATGAIAGSTYAAAAAVDGGLYISGKGR